MSANSKSGKPPAKWQIVVVILIVIVAIWFPKGSTTVGAHGASFRVSSFGLFGGLNRAVLLTDNREGTPEATESRKHSVAGWKAELERALWMSQLSPNPDALDVKQNEKLFESRIKSADKDSAKDFSPSSFFFTSSSLRMITDVILTLLVLCSPIILAFVQYLLSNAERA